MSISQRLAAENLFPHSSSDILDNSEPKQFNIAAPAVIPAMQAAICRRAAQAFASGERHNDIYHRMRSVASKLRPEATRLLGIYYSGQ